MTHQALPAVFSKPALFLMPAAVSANVPRTSRPTGGEEALHRRPTPQQGVALETLGHAIEYLVDTNFYHQRSENPNVREALAILKQSSREVFANAAPVVPARARAARWLRSRLHGPAIASDRASCLRLSLIKR